MGGVNWDAIDAELPLTQDPASRAQRVKLFERLNVDGKKNLCQKEAKEGLSELLAIGTDDALIPPSLEKSIMPAIICAFKASRDLAPSKRKGKRSGGKNGRVDLTEFHAFLVSFRYYLELAELFEDMDDSQDDNQKLSLRECRKQLHRLEVWHVDDAKLAEVFAGVEVWTGKLKFNDFADMCIKCRWDKLDLQIDDSDNDEVVYEQTAADARHAIGISNPDAKPEKKQAEAMKQVTDIFSQFDANGDGGIAEAELVQVLMRLDPTMLEEHAHTLFKAADSNQDGKVDYEEFCRWLYGV